MTPTDNCDDGLLWQRAAFIPACLRLGRFSLGQRLYWDNGKNMEATI